MEKKYFENKYFESTMKIMYLHAFEFLSQVSELWETSKFV